MFYGMAAVTALAAFLMFSLFFDVGDMILAAFKGPGAFAEWNMSKKIREARHFGIPNEILPDGSQRPIGWSSSGEALSQLRGRARLFARPGFNIKKRLARSRMALAQQGFTDEDFLEMEAYYRVDRAYNAGIVGVERLMVRGNKMEALDRLEILLREVNEKNRRAMAELLMIKLRLIVALRAPPEDVYDLFMQRLQLLKEISTIEANGYRGIPKFRHDRQRVLLQIKSLEAQMERLRTHRSEVYAAFSSGLAFGQFPPEMARVMKAAVKRQAKASGASPERTRRAIDWIETRVHQPLDREE
jgi:hypothetical protein